MTDWYDEAVNTERARRGAIRAACDKLLQELHEGTGDYDADRPTGYDIELVQLIQSHY